MTLECRRCGEDVVTSMIPFDEPDEKFAFCDKCMRKAILWGMERWLDVMAAEDRERWDREDGKI